MAFVREISACLFIVATMPITIYHSVQAARKSSVVGASIPHVNSVVWYLTGGWFGKCIASKDIILHYMLS